MNTRKISIEVPSDVLLALNENENELIKDFKISLALRFYQLHKLTIGKAAQLSGMSRFEFESLLSENNIAISNLSVDEIMKNAKKLK